MNLIASDSYREVHISKMSGKLDGMFAINTNTLSNEFCKNAYKSSNKASVCTHCYSHRMLNTYRKSAEAAWQRNSEALSGELLKDRELPTFNARYVRIHGHGELINTNHLLNIYSIANWNPHTTFALWTKRMDIVQSVHKNMDKPDNVIIVFSNPVVGSVMTTPPKYADKVFNVIPKDSTERDNCTGQKCMTCLRCYSMDRTNVIVEKLK